jgi:hypothetical protein
MEEKIWVWDRLSSLSGYIHYNLFVVEWRLSFLSGYIHCFSKKTSGKYNVFL